MSNEHEVPDTDGGGSVRDVAIDIWGSCVSRDTLEFMPDVSVGTYIARQSAIVALAPAVDLPVPLQALESDFQRRMLAGDMTSDATERLSQAEAACVLVDLVDERHGVWQFPDGTFLTNSVEAFKTGVDQWAPRMGARLVEFGTDEHFDLWRQGFAVVARRITALGKPLLLLDIAWAEVFEGQTPPRGPAAFLTRMSRRGQRGISSMVSDARRERSLRAGIRGFRAAPEATGDEHVRTAREANEKYRRYIAVAQHYAEATVSRRPNDVRMSKVHKWGIGPYHYSDHDYRKIRDELYALLRRSRAR